MATGLSVQRELSGGKPVFFYTGAPPPIKIRGLSIVQKGKTFFIVKGAAVDLDRLCRVPVIPYDRDNDEIAAWVLSPVDDKWQRTLDPERIELIRKFFQRGRSFIVNSVVLALPAEGTKVTEVDGVADIIVDVTWAAKKCPNTRCGFVPASGSAHAGTSFDACPRCEWDGRPGMIVDGQHRIRGAATAGPVHWTEPLVATILLSNQFSPSDMARIFTEITTSAVDLDPLHKLFLLYRFELQGRNIGQVSNADFTRLPPAGGARNTTGLRNRRAYEVVCTICQQPSSRWHNRITLLPSASGKARRGDVIDADRALVYIEEWLRPVGVLADPKEPDGMLPLAACAESLQDYLEALLAVWPKGGGTPPGVSTTWWQDLRGANGTLQQRGIFEVLFQLFPSVVRRLKAAKLDINKKNLTDQIRYVEEIDWSDTSWSELGAPDKNKNMLFEILDHLFSLAPNPVHSSRVAPWINTWIKANPDGVTFTSQPPPTTRVRTASKRKPIAFSWQSISPFTGAPVSKPLNAYETAALSVSQIQAGRPVTLLQDSVGGSAYSLDSPPPGLETGAGSTLVTFQVTYNRGNLTVNVSFSLPP
jgi:hypothetical protein